MAETADVSTPATRNENDILMGAFGVPDTANTIKIAYTTSTGSTSFKKQKWYRFISTTDCYLNFSTNSAAATTSHMFLKAGVPEVFYTGKNNCVFAVQDSSGGNLFATQLQTDGQN